MTRHVASSSAASQTSNVEQINTWKSLKRVNRRGDEREGAKINKGVGVGGGGYLALANVEAVSFWGVFCGQVQVSGLQEVSRSGRGGWGAGG